MGIEHALIPDYSSVQVHGFTTDIAAIVGRKEANQACDVFRFLESFNGIPDSIMVRTSVLDMPELDDIVSMTDSIMGVATEPGQIAFTVIPYGPNSKARALVKPMTAAFEAQYAEEFANPFYRQLMQC